MSLNQENEDNIFLPINFPDGSNCTCLCTDLQFPWEPVDFHRSLWTPLVLLVSSQCFSLSLSSTAHYGNLNLRIQPYQHFKSFFSISIFLPFKIGNMVLPAKYFWFRGVFLNCQHPVLKMIYIKHSRISYFTWVQFQVYIKTNQIDVCMVPIKGYQLFNINSFTSIHCWTMTFWRRTKGGYSWWKEGPIVLGLCSKALYS